MRRHTRAGATRILPSARYRIAKQGVWWGVRTCEIDPLTGAKIGAAEGVFSLYLYLRDISGRVKPS